MEEKTKTQRAYEFVLKEGCARSEAIGQAVGVECSTVPTLLRGYVQRGELVMCKVFKPGTQREVNEYRVGAGMVGEFRPLKERQAFRIGRPKADKAPAPVAALAERTRDPIERLTDALAEAEALTAALVAAEPETASEPTPARAKLELSEEAKQGIKDIHARLAETQSAGSAWRDGRAAEEPEPMRFCLWDDGDLEIYDGDETTKVPAEDVRRLHRFLNGWLGEVSA